MCHYGIIGNPLEHSLSAKYFNDFFAQEKIDAEYALYELKELTSEGVKELMGRLDGFNVTHPYKEAIIPYLRGLDPSAEAIGAVNVVYRGVGYNTDYIGFLESMRPLKRPYDDRALVLGTGGVAKAVCAALGELGIQSTMVSRHNCGPIRAYDALPGSGAIAAHLIIVNCTPLGMYPDIDSCPPIPYNEITPRHLLYDCVYNPEETEFLRRGAAQGAQTENGMQMLIGQAKAAWKIWSNGHL